MSSCDTCLVRNRAICSVLDADALEDLNRIGRRKNVRRGETVIWEGDDAPIVANVIDGMLKLTTATGDGRELIVGITFPSDFIGRPFGASSTNSVTALTDAQLCVFTRSSFDSFAKEHPDLEHELLERTLGELDRAREWMLLLGRKSAAERVASFLLEMSKRLGGKACEGPAGPADQFELPLSRQQTADILGLTIETVSRQLGRLRDAGVILTPDRRTIEIVDRGALEVEAERG
ncbi:Crp/Fnr family transcriptional regulator [Parasphingopyxis algicola]|uniref:Crp/Fnr family transcriptional regulator n=1 Tax=Parasphingopyxis algicola TaxID=2026624 RepID=UPI0015A244B7|nr:Crp/Fnr family transcriptional regulator [Parasphingopyxis algicola]QLC26523.1 Crp/Fnr family transcriptional regulator [Parasphingopyxis algicola]